MKHLKIGYFADGPWSHQALVKIISDKTLKVAFVCARHDNPDPTLEAMAIENNLLFTTHPNINSDEFHEWVSKFQSDLFVSMSFNQIFRKRLIDLPELKAINCHAGKLPFYRGRNILNWVLINDEKEFGITVHYIDSGIDTGDIIIQRCYPITEHDNYSTLLDRSYEGCAEALYEGIRKIQGDSVKSVKQEDINSFGFYCTARVAGDERLDWSQKSRDIFNFIRAICRPGPEARSFLGDAEIRINNAEYLPDAPIYKSIVGAVVGVEHDAFYVKTGDSCIKVTEWSGCKKPRIGDRLK